MKRFRKRIKVTSADEQEQSGPTAEDASTQDLPEDEEEEAVLEQEMSADENEMPVAKESEKEEASEQAALLEEIETLRNEARENYDKYLRSVAELENVKKRAQKERSELIRYAGENLARELLEVIDSLELALKQKESEGGEQSEFVRGISLIHEQFLSVFNRFGITGTSCVGEKFDPEKLEAMAMVPSAEHEPGTVIEEFKKAYFFRDKLLRAGQVVVSDVLPANADSSEEEGESSEAEGEAATQE